MTINKYLQQISPEDLAYVKRYHHEIQPFRVLPSSTLEFDGQFNGGGETIFTEIVFQMLLKMQLSLQYPKYQLLHTFLPTVFARFCLQKRLLLPLVAYSMQFLLFQRTF